MRRSFLASLALAIAVPACGGYSLPAATTPPAATASNAGQPSASPVPPVSPGPSAIAVALPPGVPAAYAEPLPAGNVPVDELVPKPAQVTGTWYVPEAAGVGEQIVVAWANGPNPFRQAHGLAVWQSFADEPPWRAVYAFLDAAREGVFGIDVLLGDLTDDGHPDVLSFEDEGGSGACGTWRVLATLGRAVDELYVGHTCDTNIVVSDGTLVLTESVFRPGDAHCCPSATRTTTIRFDGEAWQVVDRSVTEYASG